ncbi:unnamed protein product [Diplocarpon coronariae]
MEGLVNAYLISIPGSAKGRDDNSEVVFKVLIVKCTQSQLLLSRNVPPPTLQQIPPPWLSVHPAPITKYHDYNSGTANSIASSRNDYSWGTVTGI